VPETIAIAEEQQKLENLHISKASSFSTGSVQGRPVRALGDA